MKKVVSLIISLALLFGCFSITVSAFDTAVLVNGPTRKMRLYNSAGSNHNKTAEELLAPYVSADEFFAYLGEEISKCSAEVDILDYGIPCTQEIYDAICNKIFYGMPEIFNIYEIGVSYYTNGPNAGKMAVLIFVYQGFADTAKEYADCLKEIHSAGDKLLKNIENNKKLTDEQKLLLLHDRLAVWNQYGYPEGKTPIEAHTAYGALVNRTSVCQGYAMAYMYLLNRIGIESYYCSSDTLVHGWNIVKLGGKWYHVDVTWDDIGWDTDVNGAQGNVIHDNFLRSSNGIRSTGHEADDYDTTPADTKYDNYFWQNSQSEFQLVKDRIYYIDHKAASIKVYGQQDNICSVKAIWQADQSSNWMGNFSMLSSNGETLLYSQPKAIYKYDLKKQKSEQIYAPTLDKYESIYGFTYQDEKLICDINNAPPGGGDYSKKRQISTPYASAECSHSQRNTVKENEIYATCTKTGSYESIVYCMICDEELSRDTIITDALGHTENVVTQYLKKPNCKEDGMQEKIVYCTDCDYKISSETIILDADPEKHLFGNDDICDLCEFEREPIKSGDINGDATINNRDLAILMQSLNGWDVEIDQKSADVNKDNAVNNRDYALLMQYVNGWPVNLK